MTSNDQRLLELAQLKAGWMDGEGEPITEDAIDQARDLLAIYPAHIYPTLEGGIQIEANTDTWDLTIEVGPDGTAQADLTRLK